MKKWNAREAQPADAERLDALLSLLIQDEAQYGGNLNGRYVVKDNYGAKIGPEGHKLLAAEKDEHIVGFACGFLFRYRMLAGNLWPFWPPCLWRRHTGAWAAPNVCFRLLSALPVRMGPAGLNCAC